MSLVEMRRDYSLVGPEARAAEQKGLVSAQWYACPVPRKQLKELMRRKDGPAVRDTLIWFACLLVSGALAYHFWGSLGLRSLLRDLWRDLWLFLGQPLARMRPRHRVQDAVDE